MHLFYFTVTEVGCVSNQIFVFNIGMWTNLERRSSWGDEMAQDVCKYFFFGAGSMFFRVHVKSNIVI